MLLIEVHVFLKLIYLKKYLFKKSAEQREVSKCPLMKIKVPNLDFVLRRHWPTSAEWRPGEHCRQYKDFSQKTILGLLHDKGKSINKVPKFCTVDHGFDNFNLENFQSRIAHRRILEIHL